MSASFLWWKILAGLELENLRMLEVHAASFCIAQKDRECVSPFQNVNWFIKSHWFLVLLPQFGRHWVSGIPQENNMTVEKKSKWQKIKTKSSTCSAFVVHYRQSRLEISSRGTLQLFAVWKLPLIPVQNLRCRWNVSLQGSVGFWSSVLTSLPTFKTYNSFFPFEKLKEYYTPPPPGVVFFTVQNSVQRRILPFRWNGEFCACVFNNLHVATLRLRSRKPNLLTWAVNSNPYSDVSCDVTFCY